jgi:transposase
VIQKTIKYLGIAHDENQLKTLKSLAKSEISRLCKERGKPVPTPIYKTGPATIENLIEHRRFIEGFHDIFSPIFDQLELKDSFSNIRLKQLKDLVIARIADPCSKLRTAEILQKDYARSLTEDQIYKLMDHVEKQEKKIKLKIFRATKKHSTNEIVDVLFFDVTTLYFESQQNDELRKFGYSKDHKIGEVQIVLALATTPEGLPIGYSLFPGNTGEVKTLLQCLEEWRKEIKIENVIVVADRAMMSDVNLQEMEKAKFKYVIAAKLRALPKTLKDEILKRQKEIEDKIDEETIRIQEHLHNNRRLIISFSENRAKKDKGDRDRLITKLRSKLNPDGKSTTRKLITNNGYLKFTQEDKKSEIVFNESKIEDEAKWDGLHGIITNDTQAKAVDLLQRYRGLWVIEESFRINKHSLEMRPIYHFKSERIKAHILICYIAFAMTRFVQQKVQMLDQRISIEKIREELSRVEASILEDKETKELYKMPSKMSRDAAAIYRAMGVTRKESSNKY